MEDGGSGLRGLWDRVRRVPAATAGWAGRCWVWIKSHPAWLARTWPVSVPLVAVGVLFWLLPGGDLKLRYSGLALECVGLFIVARRLFLIREQFQAPTVGAVVTTWWKERPRISRRDLFLELTDVVDFGETVSGRMLTLPGAPPPEGAPMEKQLDYLRDAVVLLRNSIDSIQEGIHLRIDGVASDGARRVADLDQKLTSETTDLRATLRDSTAGNVQREQYAVVLLFLGAVLMIASAHVQP